MPYEMIINVDKEELLCKLRENRAKHKQVYEASIEGWREYAVKTLRRRASALAAGHVTEVSIRIDKPEDHTQDYDRVIGMLEMDTSDTFKIDTATFSQYVNDDWHWKRAWAKMSSEYAPGVYYSNYGTLDQNDGYF